MMKSFLLIAFLLLGVNMSADTVIAKIPIEGGFNIKLGEVMTPARFAELGSTGKADRTGRIRVYPYGTKNPRNVYFVSVNEKGETFEIFAHTGFDPEAFGTQYYKVFCLRYGDAPDGRFIYYVDPQNKNRSLHLWKDKISATIRYYDGVLSNREKAK